MSRNRGHESIDLVLVTDGLRAECEQRCHDRCPLPLFSHSRKKNSVSMVSLVTSSTYAAWWSVRPLSS